MKRLFLLTILNLFFIFSFAQKNKKLSLEVNYGLNGNFFVRSYSETAGPGFKSFYNKKFIGSIGGLEMKYKLSEKSSLGLAYAQSVNNREVNYRDLINGVSVGIIDFHIKHINKFFQLFYERSLDYKKPDFEYHLGLFYLRMNQQEIDLSNVNRSVVFEERNYKTNKLEEGGVFFGFHYSKKIDTKFDLGIKSRVYFLISTSTFEAITLTPTLTYNF